MTSPLLDLLASQMTVRLTAAHGPELRYRVHSRKRLIVSLYDTLLPEAVVENTPDNVAELNQLGAVLIKKPKPRPATPSYYD